MINVGRYPPLTAGGSDLHKTAVWAVHEEEQVSKQQSSTASAEFLPLDACFEFPALTPLLMGYNM